MDDITKTIIAVLAGFVTAFLAEPVKIYFQNRAKLRDLKVGLYKELWNNYELCGILSSQLPKLKNFITGDEFGILKAKSGLIVSISKTKQDLRAECYQRSLKDDLLLFYRLPEADQINNLQQGLSYFLEFDLSEHITFEGIEFEGTEYEVGILISAIDALNEYCHIYSNNFATRLMNNYLDKAFFRRVIGRYEYNIIVKNYHDVISNIPVDEQKIK